MGSASHPGLFQLSASRAHSEDCMFSRCVGTELWRPCPQSQSCRAFVAGQWTNNQPAGRPTNQPTNKSTNDKDATA
eukprot:15481119-Alexandrium_andersonii.AAC.1